MTEIHSNSKKSNLAYMPRVQKRKYEKIEQAEIDLVIQCHDSHEFYNRYREVFPDRKKGIDSISKIWKRRGDFLKKQQNVPDTAESGIGLSPELEILVTAQNRILVDLTAIMKEHLQLTREILERLPKQVQKSDEPSHKPVQPRNPEPKEPARKPSHEKPTADIVVGS